MCIRYLSTRATFPDPKYAQAVWERRANGSFFLGAAIVTALLYVLEAIHSWWAIAITFVICLVTMGFVQPMLVLVMVLLRANLAAFLTVRRIKAGLKVRSPMLAPFVWTYYLTEEERRLRR